MLLGIVLDILMDMDLKVTDLLKLLTLSSRESKDSTADLPGSNTFFCFSFGELIGGHGVKQFWNQLVTFHETTNTKYRANA
jgi:hypothetical protein